MRLERSVGQVRDSIHRNNDDNERGQNKGVIFHSHLEVIDFLVSLLKFIKG
jgi:hypothetical protein